ncbi:MAG: hypothetical protein ACI841_002109 [Planctomycetota bacterium]|jgi:hypothetical protein
MREPEQEAAWVRLALSRRGLVALIGVALVVRVLALVVSDALDPARTGEAWEWGQEMACMARSIAVDGVHGDPWGDDTGPSAWLTPLYPALMAVCIKLAGGINATAAALLFACQIVFSIGTGLLLLSFGRALRAPAAGVIAAWIFVLMPASIWNSAHTVWDTSAVALGLLAFLTFALKVGPRPKLPQTFALGAAFGGVLFLNPAVATFGPGVLLFLRAGSDEEPEVGGGRLARWCVFSAGSLLLCLPWMLRNHAVIGTLGLRSNLGVELRVGNNDQAQGRHEVLYHPSHTPAELARYRELGEREFNRSSGAAAREWVIANPGRFTELSLYRAFLFWFGESPAMDPRGNGRESSAQLALGWAKWAMHSVVGLLALLCLFRFARGHVARPLVLTGCLLFPLPYYVTHVAERYRFPIEPLLVFIVVWVALSLWNSRKLRGRTRSING